MKSVLIALFVILTFGLLYVLPYILLGFAYAGWIGIFAGCFVLVGAYAALLTQIWRRILPSQR